jgi:uncharacterized tellurite resistance protein B-like protein
MWFGKRSSVATAVVGDRLDAVIRAQLPDADDDALRLTTAIAGLLASVAYADRKYTAEEQAQVREALSRVPGLDAAAVETICATLQQHIVRIGVGNTQTYTRDLRDLAERDARLEVLDVLVDLAAADGELVLAETDLLRRTASALGLSPDDYLASQQRHRERLALLKPTK